MVAQEEQQQAQQRHRLARPVQGEQQQGQLQPEPSRLRKRQELRVQLEELRVTEQRPRREQHAHELPVALVQERQRRPLVAALLQPRLWESAHVQAQVQPAATAAVSRP
jgi:hypothetical protein